MVNDRQFNIHRDMGIKMSWNSHACHMDWIKICTIQETEARHRSSLNYFLGSSTHHWPPQWNHLATGTAVFQCPRSPPSVDWWRGNTHAPSWSWQLQTLLLCTGSGLLSLIVTSSICEYLKMMESLQMRSVQKTTQPTPNLGCSS